MSSLREYFQTDWAAMTVNDWIGVIVTILVFVAMVVVYVQVLRPKNRERLESRRHIPFEDEEDDERSGDRDG